MPKHNGVRDNCPQNNKNKGIDSRFSFRKKLDSYFRDKWDITW